MFSFVQTIPWDCKRLESRECICSLLLYLQHGPLCQPLEGTWQILSCETMKVDSKPRRLVLVFLRVLCGFAACHSFLH